MWSLSFIFFGSALMLLILMLAKLRNILVDMLTVNNVGFSSSSGTSQGE